MYASVSTSSFKISGFPSSSCCMILLRSSSAVMRLGKLFSCVISIARESARHKQSVRDLHSRSPSRGSGRFGGKVGAVVGVGVAGSAEDPEDPEDPEAICKSAPPPSRRISETCGCKSAPPPSRRISGTCVGKVVGRSVGKDVGVESYIHTYTMLLEWSHIHTQAMLASSCAFVFTIGVYKYN